MAKRIVKPKLLVVEGKKDKRFFKALITKLGLQDIQVRFMEGKSGYRAKLKAIYNTENFAQVRSLGITRDANDNPDGTFQSVRDALQVLDLPAPSHPMEFTSGSPNVMVMILPRKNAIGELEDLCLKSVENDKAIHCVEQYFQCIKERDLDEPRKVSKAKVQVFLASKRELAADVGWAAEKGYWRFEEEAFEEAKVFLHQIFS